MDSAGWVFLSASEWWSSSFGHDHSNRDCSGRFANICHTPPKTSKPPQSDPTQWNAHLWSQTYAAHCLVNTLNIVASLITMTMRVNWFYPVRKLIWILAYLVVYSQLLQGARKLFSVLYTRNVFVTRDHKSIHLSIYCLVSSHCSNIILQIVYLD